MKSLQVLVATAALIGASTISFAALAQSASAPMGEMKMDKPATASDMTEGEIRKVDKEASKITIKHGTIQSIDMPPMTMVFTVKDAALLEQVKPGDKVKFDVVREDGKLVVTHLEAVQP